jgi:hypothetical protein
MVRHQKQRFKDCTWSEGFTRLVVFALDHGCRAGSGNLDIFDDALHANNAVI